MCVSLVMDVIPRNNVSSSSCNRCADGEYQSSVKCLPQQTQHFLPLCIVWKVGGSIGSGISLTRFRVIGLLVGVKKPIVIIGFSHISSKSTLQSNGDIIFYHVYDTKLQMVTKTLSLCCCHQQMMLSSINWHVMYILLSKCVISFRKLIYEIVYA